MWLTHYKAFLFWILGPQVAPNFQIFQLGELTSLPPPPTGGEGARWQSRTPHSLSASGFSVVNFEVSTLKLHQISNFPELRPGPRSQTPGWWGGGSPSPPQEAPRCCWPFVPMTFRPLPVTVREKKSPSYKFGLTPLHLHIICISQVYCNHAHLGVGVDYLATKIGISLREPVYWSTRPKSMVIHIALFVIVQRTVSCAHDFT